MNISIIHLAFYLGAQYTIVKQNLFLFHKNAACEM